MSTTSTRRIVIVREGEGFAIKFEELLAGGVAHGIEVRVSNDGITEIYGFGKGLASPLNMFQSHGQWRWATLRVDEGASIGLDYDCESLVQLVYAIVKYVKSPLLSAYIKDFVEAYPMHGKKVCARIERTT